MKQKDIHPNLNFEVIYFELLPPGIRMAATHQKLLQFLAGVFLLFKREAICG